MASYCRCKTLAPGLLLSFNEQDQIHIKLSALSKSCRCARHGQYGSLVIRDSSGIQVAAEASVIQLGQYIINSDPPVAPRKLPRVTLPVFLGSWLNIIVACMVRYRQTDLCHMSVSP